MSRSLPGGASWVAGVALVSDRDELSRAIVTPNNERTIIGVTNVTRSASLFGEATVPLSPALSITAGARGTLGRTAGSPSSAPRSNSFVRGRSTHRIDPTLAVSQRLAPDLALFGRFQTGYRTGGVAVAQGVGRVADYRSDAITVGEVGLRRLRSGATGLALSVGVSLAHWTDIQADLITRRGQPYTANIGDARIRTLEGAWDWVPVAGLRAQGSFLVTDNAIYGAVADQPPRNNR